MKRDFLTINSNYFFSVLLCLLFIVSLSPLAESRPRHGGIINGPVEVARRRNEAAAFDVDDAEEYESSEKDYAGEELDDPSPLGPRRMKRTSRVCGSATDISRTFLLKCPSGLKKFCECVAPVGSAHCTGCI